MLDDKSILVQSDVENINRFINNLNEDIKNYTYLNERVNSSPNGTQIKYKMSFNQKKYFNLLLSINRILNDVVIKDDLDLLRKGGHAILKETKLKMNYYNFL